MSSSKDTFEPNAFEADTFASGAWRGRNVLAEPDMLGAEWIMPTCRGHYAQPVNRGHFVHPGTTGHFAIPKED